MQTDDVTERVTAVLTSRYGSGGGIEPFDRADFLHAFGNARDALLYSAVFVPEFIEVEGFIFLKELGILPAGGWPEVAKGVRQACAISRRALQEYVDSCNWIEVPYLFSDRLSSDEECDVLARAIARAWDQQLRARFSDRDFSVRVLSPTETGSTVGVGFEIGLSQSAAQSCTPDSSPDNQ